MTLSQAYYSIPRYSRVKVNGGQALDRGATLSYSWTKTREFNFTIFPQLQSFLYKLVGVIFMSMDLLGICSLHRLTVTNIYLVL